MVVKNIWPTSPHPLHPRLSCNRGMVVGVYGIPSPQRFLHVPKQLQNSKKVNLPLFVSLQEINKIFLPITASGFMQ